MVNKLLTKPVANYTSLASYSNNTIKYGLSIVLILLTVASYATTTVFVNSKQTQASESIVLSPKLTSILNNQDFTGKVATKAKSARRVIDTNPNGQKESIAQPSYSHTPSRSKALDNNRVGQTTITAIPAIISGADNDANEMNLLKRQLELAKIKAQINKEQSNSNPRAVNSTRSTAQALVTAVIIDKQQPQASLASLLFADGGTLDVRLGSKLEGYSVSEINLDGVVLSKTICKSHRSRCTRHLQIKRIYVDTLKKRDKANNIYVPYSATQVLGNSEDDSSTIAIPPIVKGKI